MIYLNSFIFMGFICLIAQIILDNTNFTAGHITCLFTCVGALLEFFGIYSYFINKCGMGAIGLITNFGASLFNSALNGYISNGILGLFKEFLCQSSLVLISTIVFSFVITVIFKSRD